MNRSSRQILKFAIISFLILVHLTSCSTKTQKDSFIRLDSDFQTTNSLHLKSPIPAVNRLEAYGRHGSGLTDEFFDSLHFWDRNAPELTEQRKKFNIWVDTSNSVAMEFQLNELGFPEPDSLSFSVDSTYENYGSEWANFSGLPVYIQNEDTVEHVLEFQEGSVYMIYEAQDSTGTWRPIENWVYTHFCGNSYYELVVKPRSYFVSKVIKYNGEFETNLRLKFRNFDFVTYSNIFKGTINYEQFNDSNFVAYSNEMAEIYSRNPDSLISYAKNYLAKMRLEKSF